MRAMRSGVKVGLKVFLPIVGIVGLLFLVWPYWELLVVVAALTGFCFAGYYAGKIRQN
jgi:hypothetical protein